ncbi:phosphoesterase [Actinorhabdospora filicis]|uniref:Phosphoesterase n=1 Tax=Actinorhabdospora filicis TaxID=1785913 RepID=A0A9W6SN38_9ACTN|nr:metallophosphoesterase family protein [Actinorhabdospora filicis]GLZ78812.1 phosphoesterase [Actinorhabdospora filicis]
MSIAVISDVHGVAPALEAVLSQPEVATAEVIVCCGDVAAGPQPTQVLDRLAALGDRVRYVSGNADREMADWHPGTTAAYPDEVTPWAASVISAEHRAWMASWPHDLTLTVDGLGEVYFCHATPRRDDEVIVVDSRPDLWTQIQRQLPATVSTMVIGNTHMPFARLAGNRMIVNPGSVGMPYGPPGAYWALLGPGIQLRRTPLDADTVCAQVATSPFPGATRFAEEYLRGAYSDFDALAVFGPRDGR